MLQFGPTTAIILSHHTLAVLIKSCRLYMVGEEISVSQPVSNPSLQDWEDIEKVELQKMTS